MVKLNFEIDDPTLLAMYEAIENKQKDEKQREYLGASSIGHDCARAVYYGYHNYPRKPFKARTLMMFDDGHRTEDLTAERLRMIEGIKLHTHKPDGYQYGFSDLDGKFRGHCDGVIEGLLQSPSNPHVWEHKSCEHKKYNEFIKCLAAYGEKDALENWSMIYYVQAQLYMHYFGLTRHYLTVSLGGGRDYKSCRTEYKKEVALYYIDRAKKIIEAKSEPLRLSENKDFWKCKFCDYREICHG